MAFGTFGDDTERGLESMGIKSNALTQTLGFAFSPITSMMGRQQRKAEQAESAAREQARKQAQAKNNASVTEAFNKRRAAFDMSGGAGLSPGQKNASMEGTTLIGNNQTQQTSIIGGGK